AGNIAQEVVRRAASFGMPVVLWSRRFDGVTREATEADLKELNLTDAAGLALRIAATPGDVASQSDLLSVHLALAADTRNIINAALLTKLPKGAFLVNTSRGEVVDHAALLEAVKTRGLRVALDVFDNEPAGATGDFSSPLLAQPNVYGTHHI